jgi:hypothetical protein
VTPPRTSRRPVGRAGRRARRLEAALRTGPAAHLLGGALDVVQAISRYALARVRGRRVR